MDVLPVSISMMEDGIAWWQGRCVLRDGGAIYGLR